MAPWGSTASFPPLLPRCRLAWRAGSLACVSRLRRSVLWSSATWKSNAERSLLPPHHHGAIVVEHPTQAALVVQDNTQVFLRAPGPSHGQAHVLLVYVDH